MDKNTQESLQLFEDQPVRTAWDEEHEEWYFSVVDVVGILTESKDPTAYWRKLKQRLKDEGNETVTNCHGLKMKAADGKRRLTVVANTEQLLRIIQSIPSKSIMHIKNIRREISNRTSAYSTIDHFAIWEQFNYIDFYRMGFRTVKNEPERLIMTPTKWINRMNVIGITLKAGRYGGTYQVFLRTRQIPVIRV